MPRFNKAYYNGEEVTKAYLDGVLVLNSYPLSNIISEWKFEDNVLDTVGANDGVATALTYATGLVGKAGVFNGTTSKVTVANESTLSFGDGVGNDSPFSISVLFSTTNNGDSDRWLQRRDLGQDEYQFIYLVSSNRLNFSLLDNTVSNYILRQVAFIPVNNQVYHIVGTYDGSKTIAGMKIYVDGVELTDTALNATAGTYNGMTNAGSSLVIGQRPTNVDPLGGTLNCLRIWDKELSQSEITLIATQELAGVDINP